MGACRGPLFQLLTPLRAELSHPTHHRSHRQKALGLHRETKQALPWETPIHLGACHLGKIPPRVQFQETDLGDTVRTEQISRGAKANGLTFFLQHRRLEEAIYP